MLGNREDENQFTPYLVNPKMYEFKKVVEMALGTQHVVALALDSPESKVPELNISAFEKGQPTQAKAAEPEPAAEESEP